MHLCKHEISLIQLLSGSISGHMKSFWQETLCFKLWTYQGSCLLLSGALEIISASVAY